MASSLSVVILAAGKGTRMNGALPKVLHPLAGRPLLAHVVETASALNPEQICVVVGHGAESVRRRFADCGFTWVEQKEQLGTGHAVAQALPLIPDDASVLVLYGDVPLVTPDTLSALVQAGDRDLSLLTTRPENPAGYGRIVRDATKRIVGIVEEKDANEEQRRIPEVNTGLLACPAALLRALIGKLGRGNAQREYYLTDVVGMAADEGRPIQSQAAENSSEVLGVNDRSQLAAVERAYQLRLAERFLNDGVTLMDPSRFDVRGELRCGRDVVIDVNAVFEGTVILEDGVHVGAHCVIRDCRIGACTEVLPFSHLDGATIGSEARIGPYARLRPGADLADHVHVGNFVEVKQSTVGKGSKISHLSYVGDARVGQYVNIGAGTITCNYDGARKHQTEIGDGAFIGSGTELVAPVTVGAGANIGAGSTIRKDAPANKLTLSSTKQRTVDGWKRPVKKS
ncbi:MAG: bifunctional UDP-N-acetylglucosamine diphosphorylase/glucosamine-1-phosphate N-acetyltransferase GlmU [Pseudomonadota bacterium]|nr:bifunctional UDP-N-acetylglucosamine diphosphorylase/glucosamine-1-phosphate N-acetyltransferase GlmU [Pseudomonadota bacterium]